MDDAELRLLQERAWQLKELTAHPGFDVLAEVASERIAAKQARLVGGSVESMIEYAQLTGWLAGAKYVVSLPVDLERRLAEQPKR